MAAGPIGSTSGLGDFADLFLADFLPDFFLDDDGLLEGLLLLLLVLAVALFDDNFFFVDFADPVTLKKAIKLNNNKT